MSTAIAAAAISSIEETQNKLDNVAEESVISEALGKRNNNIEAYICA